MTARRGRVQKVMYMTKYDSSVLEPVFCTAKAKKVL